MLILRKAIHLNIFLQQYQQAGIGFVPTMGALHNGHISLISEAFAVNKIVVCSIFVNPSQFNDVTDFEKYPKTLEQDIRLLEMACCHVLFAPSVNEMYPEGMAGTDIYNLGNIEFVLEGKYRPGHFQGVCKVVHRLLQMVNPARLYLGQKDFQQCMVIKKLLELTGIKTEVIICPTQREADGLAMSSRNLRLPTAHRFIAPLLFETLSEIKNRLQPDNFLLLKQKALKNLTDNGFVVDYIEIADTATLDLTDEFVPHQQLVLLAAASIGKIRLIDNLLLY